MQPHKWEAFVLNLWIGPRTQLDPTKIGGQLAKLRQEHRLLRGMRKDRQRPEAPNENSTIGAHFGQRALDRKEVAAPSDETTTFSEPLVIAI